jgi:preprotein translocase subunit YajC
MTNTQSASVPAATPTGSLLGSMAPILLIVVIFYFLIIRPQQKRDAKNRELINSLKKDDKVVTTAGIIGVVHKIVDDQEISLEISEGVRIRILKNSVSKVLGKKTVDKEADEQTQKTDKATTRVLKNTKLTTKKTVAKKRK